MCAGGIVGAVVLVVTVIVLVVLLSFPECPHAKHKYEKMTAMERNCVVCGPVLGRFVQTETCFDKDGLPHECTDKTRPDGACQRVFEVAEETGPRAADTQKSQSGSPQGGGSGGSSGGGGACFPPDTLVVLSSKAAVPISSLRLGDQLDRGGRVEALMQLEGRADPLFDVGGVWVSGSHAVRDPRDGLWRRVQHAGRPLNTTAPVLWNVISEHHRVVALPRTDGGPAVELADFMEVDDSPELLEHNLRILNDKEGL